MSSDSPVDSDHRLLIENSTTSNLKKACVTLSWKLPLIILVFFIISNAITQWICTMILIPISPPNATVTDRQLIIENLHKYFNIIFRFLHVVEYIVLTLSIIIRKCCKGSGERRKPSHSIEKATCCTVTTAFLILVIPFYFSVIIIPPVLYTVWPADLQNYQSVAYTITQFGAFLSNFMLRTVLILITIRVIYIWIGKLQQTSSRNHSLQSGTPTSSSESNCRGTQTEEIANPLKELVDEYDGKGELAKNLHTLFREWFVLQWIIYFLEIAEDFYFIYDILYSNKTAGHQLCWHSSLLLYRIFAFGIPYSCGLLMNHYHKMCYKKIMKNQRERLLNDPDKSIRIMFAADLIPENQDYNFIPSLCGISIPLNVSGHTLTIVLTCSSV